MRLVDYFCELFAFVLDLFESQEQQDVEAHQIHKRCLELVETARQCGRDHGLEQHRFEQALFAVVVWIDEVIICSDLPFVRQWPNFFLQLHFFNTNNGGDEFYDRLEAIDKKEDELIEIFAYCLALGFHGRLYADSSALAERRAELYNCLSTSPAPSDKLFPAAYRNNNEEYGKPHKRETARTAVLFLLPLVALFCLYVICSYRLDIQMSTIFGG
uniref:DotU family type IV/VI secretion system protein n=1 Tax=Candidatus Electrothrix sp. TaxID=2170559 RepID=UPI004057969C